MTASPYAKWEQLEELMFGQTEERIETGGVQVRAELKNKIVADVRDHLVLGHRQTLGRAIMDQSAKNELQRIIRDYVVEKNLQIPGFTLQQIVGMLMDEIVGLGPLQGLMSDDKITEIVVNGPYEVRIQKDGQWHLLEGVRFESEDHLQLVARKILNLADATVTLAQPIVDARLPEARVNVSIPPVARVGTTINIRKFPPLNLTEEAMIKTGLLTGEMLELLKILVKGAANIIVAGATGSGKTTLLKRLAEYIPDNLRILTIEDTEEMRLKSLYPHKHVVSYECRHTNNEETNIDMARLLKNSLRQTPDRIITGEVRGPEAYIMIEAMNTGHDGGITTLHANNAADAIKRLVQMTLRSGLQLTPELIGQMIADVIDIVIFQRRLLNGQRVIQEIVEVRGYENGRAVVQPLFEYHLEETEEGKILGGRHIRHESGYISKELANKLMMNGVTRQELKGWVQEG